VRTEVRPIGSREGKGRGGTPIDRQDYGGSFSLFSHRVSRYDRCSRQSVDCARANRGIRRSISWSETYETAVNIVIPRNTVREKRKWTP